MTQSKPTSLPLSEGSITFYTKKTQEFDGGVSQNLVIFRIFYAKQ